MTNLDEGYCRVLPNILKSTTRQLKILDASSGLPIEVAAGACRTTFELNIRLRVVLNDAQAMKDFIAEVLYDERKLIESFKRLRDEDTPSAIVERIAEREAGLAEMERTHGLKKPAKQSWKERATDRRIPENERIPEDEYDALYGLYSNYTHATAWLVNKPEGSHDEDAAREILTTQTQKNAEDTYKRIQEALRRRAIAKPS
jgi:hypothetical protein